MLTAELSKELKEILLYLLVIAIAIIQENLSRAAATFIVGLFQSMHIYYPIRLSIKFAPATFRRRLFADGVCFSSQSRSCIKSVVPPGLTQVFATLINALLENSAYGCLNCIQFGQHSACSSLIFHSKTSCHSTKQTLFSEIFNG